MNKLYHTLLGLDSGRSCLDGQGGFAQCNQEWCSCFTRAPPLCDHVSSRQLSAAHSEILAFLSGLLSGHGFGLLSLSAFVSLISALLLGRPVNTHHGSSMELL